MDFLSCTIMAIGQEAKGNLPSGAQKAKKKKKTLKRFETVAYSIQNEEKKLLPSVLLLNSLQSCL